MIRRHWLPAALFVGFGSLLAWQLFFPGFIGIADTGDFARVAGWLCLAPRGAPSHFTFFQPEYTWSAHNFWDSPYTSSETALGWLAIQLAGATHEGALFDIRWLGALHVTLCLAGFAALLAALRERPKRIQAVVAAVPLLLLTDVCYTALLNSFYMDAAAFCSLLLMAGTAVWISVAEEPRTSQLGLFLVAALLFVTSKTQHAIWSFFPALFLTFCCTRIRQRRLRVAALGMAALVFASGVYMERTADRAYKGQALFNLLFYRIGSEGSAAMPELVKLGVKPDEVRYLGTHSYAPGSPMENSQFAEQFYERTGFARVLAWYLHHPAKTLRMVSDRLLWEAEIMRANNLGNYRVEAGHPPRARTHRFGLWSDMRSALFHRAPWYFLFWYCLFVAGCVTAIRGRRSPVSTRVAWVALGIALLGAGEFLASNLADCLDMARHLFLFHACTDLTLCFAVAWAVERATFLRAGRASRSPAVRHWRAETLVGSNARA
uniref:Glycosyltransferase RgtA/B/C/D-like domain-containing protein n=1 Tax=Solibacter usitatus (strain Ellin6076) TaxID=234267 RepID=Q01VA6_SOLUE